MASPYYFPNFPSPRLMFFTPELEMPMGFSCVLAGFLPGLFFSLLYSSLLDGRSPSSVTSFRGPSFEVTKTCRSSRRLSFVIFSLSEAAFAVLILSHRFFPFESVFLSPTGFPAIFYRFVFGTP